MTYQFNRHEVQMCCEDTRKQQEQYYLNQAGGSLPHFAGREYQKGHGIGSTISGAVKSAIPLLTPFIKKAAKTLKRKLMTAGVGVVGDVISGKKLKTAVADRAKESLGIKNTPTTPRRRQPNKKKPPTKVTANKKRAIPSSARRGATSRNRYLNTAFQ